MTGAADVLPGSFRDPAGFVFRRDGVLFRQVNEVHRRHFDLLMSSGLYDALTTAALLIPHEVVDDEPAAAGAYLVIRPRPVGFVSYPYEWSFSQLRDAALATLRIQSAALDHGMTLRDASAFNVQFDRGRPLLIDTLSFEVLVEDRPWIAYRQFCQHFLAPLALMSYRDARLGLFLREHLDGVPLDLAAQLLPKGARLRPPLLLHLFSHAKSQRKHATDEAPAARSGRASRFSMQAFRGLLDSLRSGIEGLSLPDGFSEWRNYYDEATHYSDQASAHKEELVDACIAEVAPETVWDLGANVGRFSRLATARGIPTVAFDVDPACVDEAYRRASSENETRLLPLVLDLANPSPAIGWANRERMTVAERGPADLVLALALVHHLAIGNNVPLASLAAFFAEIGRHVVIEFVPKQDEKVQRLLMNREDVFPTYSVEGFERSMSGHFDVLRKLPIHDSPRTLYLLRAR
jgi:hypothetical protein